MGSEFVPNTRITNTYQNQQHILWKILDKKREGKVSFDGQQLHWPSHLHLTGQSCDCVGKWRCK